MSTLVLDVKREIGKHFVVGFNGTQVNDEIKTLIRDYFVGNVILFKRNIEDAAQVYGLIRDLQTLARDSGHDRPLLVGIDQENGVVSALTRPAAGTQFPGAMAMAATGSVDTAEYITAASAKELKMVGINWVYSPVADINSEPRNPVIGVRSFGDDPLEVSQFVCTVARTLESFKVASSAKHFPGHGDTHVDSHLSLPRILKSKEQLSSNELVPFRYLIENEVASIMTGHMALPTITGDDAPCSLSRTITTDLLRHDMGYKGVVVTDCLEMNAVAALYGTEKGAVKALMVGADIAMICHRFDRQSGAVQAVYEAVESGRLSMEELIISGRRIAAMKDRFVGTWDDVLGLQFDTNRFQALKQDHQRIRDQAYASSIALIKDTHKHIPIQRDSSVVLFTPSLERINPAVDDPLEHIIYANGRLRNTAGASFLSLGRSISERMRSSPQAGFEHIVYVPDDRTLTPEALRALGNANAIIFVTRNAHQAAWQLNYLNAVVAEAGEKKIVVLASCAPYDLMDVRPEVVDRVAYLASFEFTPPALDAAAKVMFGEVLPRGRVPVLKGKVVSGI